MKPYDRLLNLELSNGSTCWSIRINVIRKPLFKGNEMSVRILACLLIFLVSPLSQYAVAHETPQQAFKHKLEVSFGQSLLFLKADPNVTGGATSGSLPMSSALFLGEWILNQHFAYLSAVTIPLTTQQTLVNGQLYHEKSSPTLSFGGRWSMISISVTDDTHCEVQFAALFGRTFDEKLNGQYFPTIGSRLMLLKNDGFSLYAGTTWSFTLETLALIYGVGHRF